MCTGPQTQTSKVQMSAHRNKDSLRPRGIRLHESTWKELEAVQIRRDHSTMQDAVREAVEDYLAKHSRPLSRAA